jgi:hypothetical protein
MNWSIVKLDTLYVTILIGELEYIVHKSDVTIDPYDTETVLVTIELFKYAKFQVSPVDKYPICYAVNYRECVSPIAATRDDLVIALNEILVEGIKVAKNGTLVGEESKINFIEGTNITITAVDDPANNKVDVTINASGGGGGVTTFSGGTTGLTPAAPTSGAVTLAGTLVVANGGTGLSALGSGLQYLRVNAGATALEYATFPSVVTDDPFPKILMLMGG